MGSYPPEPVAATGIATPISEGVVTLCFFGLGTHEEGGVGTTLEDSEDRGVRCPPAMGRVFNDEPGDEGRAPHRRQWRHNC